MGRQLGGQLNCLRVRARLQMTRFESFWHTLRISVAVLWFRVRFFWFQNVLRLVAWAMHPTSGSGQEQPAA
jgi:hypothetical protein